MDKIVDLIREQPDQISALAAVSALFVSFLSIVLTVWALWLQRRHNFKSLTPIANVLYGDYENLLEVKVKNSGVGPLIIERFTASRGSEKKHNIIDWMPDITYSTFTSRLDGRCISPDQEIVLIRLKGNQDDPDFRLRRDEVRRSLSELNVQVRYRDIYDRRMKDEGRSLDWFARRLAEAPVAKTLPPESAGVSEVRKS